MARDELRQRIDTIEDAYEFMLAYAAQGLPSDEGSKSGGELRHKLERLDTALTGLADLFRELSEAEEGPSKSEILAPLVPIPTSLEEMNAIAARIASLLAFQNRTAFQLTKLRLLKTALMQDLLTGKRRVTDLLEAKEAMTA